MMKYSNANRCILRKEAFELLVELGGQVFYYVPSRAQDVEYGQLLDATSIGLPEPLYQAVLVGLAIVESAISSSMACG